MKNLYTPYLKSALVAVAMIAGTSFTVMATEGTGTKENPYILEDGGSYSLNNYSIYTKYTATADGHLVLMNPSKFLLSTVETYENGEYASATWMADPDATDGSYIYQTDIPVEAGKTYYPYQTFGTQNSIVRVSFSATRVDLLKLDHTNPEEGSVFSITNGNEVSFQFNRSVAIDSVTMSYGNKNERLTYDSYNGFVAVAASDLIDSLLTHEIMKPGDSFSIKLYGIADINDANNIYGEDGTCTLSLIAPESPVSMLTTTKENGSTFNSYYLNSDSAGIIVLTFNGDLMPNVVRTADSCYVELNYGDRESGYAYVEVLSPVIKGNVMTIDLTGKRRTASDMIPSAAVSFGDISMSIKGVRSAKGDYVRSNVVNGVGTLTFVYAYKELNYNILTTFYPESGSNIDRTSEIEIGVSNASYMKFAGVTFTYINKGIAEPHTVALADIRAENGGAMEPNTIYYMVPVPAFDRDANTTVTMHIDQAECADGRSITDDVTYTTSGYTAIENVKTDAASSAIVNIYDINATLVGKAVAGEALKGLDAGFYIVNGKKVVIR